MYKLLIAVLLVIGQLSAQDFNSRFLIRGSKQFESSNFGLVGWTVAPNIVKAADKWLHIAGVEYKTKEWNLEVMGGAVLQAGEGTKLIDIRAGFNEALFGNTGLGMWSGVQWIDPLSDSDIFYLYHQVSYPLIDKALVSFIETENMFYLDTSQTNELSFGIGLLVPVSEQMKIMAVNQWHNQGPNQFWIRTVISL